VEPLPIIEDFNIVGNILFRFAPGGINGTVHPLVFERREKGFGQSIVVATSGAAQGLPHLQRSKFPTEFG
jgi:hypothetical protein